MQVASKLEWPALWLFVVLLLLPVSHGKKNKKSRSLNSQNSPTEWIEGSAAWRFTSNEPNAVLQRAAWARHCLSLSKYPIPATLYNFSIAEHAEAYAWALATTKRWRATPMHTYAGYGGPWEENHWISTFMAKGPGFFIPLIPLFIPFMDMFERFRGAKGLAMAKMALRQAVRKEWTYITVAEADFGLAHLVHTGHFPNVIVLSSGGYGHVPIPLLKEAVPLRRGPRRHLVGSVVTMWKKRRAFLDALKRTSLRGSIVHYHGKEWRSVLRESVFCLAPRGNGRTSFHLSESIQAGCIPIYAWDDLPWLPYSPVLNWSQFSILASFMQAEVVAARVEALVAANATEAMLDKVAQLRGTHFLFPALMDHIKLLLTSPSTAHLSCQPLPSSTGVTFGR